MEKAGMHLRKWVANDERILADIQHDDATEKICIEENESIKTLGLQWDPKKDTFTFSAENPMLTRLTKRIVLSQLSRIFDPLGWLAPVTIQSKCFIQNSASK